MSFKGDLSTIGLAEVFQMISMAGKAGTLIVQDEESRKCIYFDQQGVQLISTGRRKGLRLGELLVRAGKLSEFRLKEVLENQKITKKLLGEALIESGSVTEQDIHDVVRSQIEEEIYDLFLWRKAVFEFIEGEASAEFRDAESTVTRLSFDVNGLLLEAVRRADEWKIINTKIQGMDSIFTFTSDQARRDEDKTSTDDAKRVYSRIDGQSTANEIVELAALTKFAVCKCLVDLLERGRIRTLTVGEVLDAASRKMSEGRREKAMSLFRAAVAQAPNDPEVAIRYARVLESEGQNKEASSVYAHAASLCGENGRREEALPLLQKAAGLNPEDEKIKQSIFEAHVSNQNREEAAKIGHELAATALGRKDFEGARKIGESLVGLDSRDLHARLTLAKACNATGKKTEVEEQVQYIRKNLPLDQAEAAKILKEIGDLTPRSERSKTIVPARRKRKKGLFIGIAIGVIVLGAVGAAGKFEMDARTFFADCLAKSKKELEARRYGEARQELERFNQSVYRHSPLVSRKLEAELQAIAAAEDYARQTADLEAARQHKKAVEQLDRDYEEVERAWGEGDLPRASEGAARVAKAAEELKETELAGKARDLHQKAESAIAQAYRLKSSAEAFIKEGKFKEAAGATDELLRSFSRSVPAVDAEFVLAVYSIPAGVSVIDLSRSEPTKKVSFGKTERMNSEDPRGRLLIPFKPLVQLRLGFEKDHYKSAKSMLISDRTVGEIEVTLSEKLVKWDLPFVDSLNEEPLVVDKVVYIAHGENLDAVPAGRNLIDWSESLGKRVVGSPCRVQKLIALASLANKIHVFDPSRSSSHQVASLELPAAPLYGLAVSKDGLWGAVACGNGQLIAVDFTDSTHPKASEPYALPSPAAVAPRVENGIIYVSCTDRSMRAFSASNPVKLLWSKDLGGTAVSAPILWEKYVVVCLSDGRIKAMPLEDRARDWERQLPSTTSGQPAVSGSTLIVPCKDGTVHALSLKETGAEKWTFKSSGAISGGAASAGDLVLFGAEDQNFYALDVRTGKQMWRCATDAAIRSSPAVSSTTVFFGAENKVLYAVELD